MVGGDNEKMTNLLEVKDLSVKFFTREGIISAVNNVSFSIKKGETVGIVGESGSGKSVSVMSIIQLINSPPGKIVNGKINFNGEDLLKLNINQIRNIRGNLISMIFQDPMSNLNPVLTIGDQIIEALKKHLKMDDNQARNRAIELLEMTGISPAKQRIYDYPHQISGGMRQRVMIAMGIACNPKLLIADEPTTALDVTIQAQIINVIKKIQKIIGMSIIWITHDLGVVAGSVDRVLVMYAGSIVEEASVKELFKNPRHPYTIGLLRSIPRIDQDLPEKLFSIKGLPPNLMNYPEGCSFYSRCDYRINKCLVKPPEFRTVNTDHKFSCYVNVSLTHLYIADHGIYA